MRIATLILALALMTACGGTDQTKRGESLIFTDVVASCLERSALPVLVEKHGGLLIYEEITVRATSGLVTVRVYDRDHLDRAKEEEDALRFYETEEDRERIARVANAVVRWDAEPAKTEADMVNGCLREGIG